MLALDVSPDIRVLSLTLALTFGTGLLFGLAPALQVSKPDLSSVMKQDSSGSAGAAAGGCRRTLVGAQVALCMLLMAGAGLLLRGLYAAHSVDPGFVYGDVVCVLRLRRRGLRRARRGVPTPPARERARGARRRVCRARAAGAARHRGHRGGSVARATARASRGSRRSTPSLRTTFRSSVSRSCSGRTFTDADLSDDARVAIVSRRPRATLGPAKIRSGRRS